MSLAYGYDLKGGDKMLEAPVEAAKIMTPLVLPGSALVNHLPICALSNFVHAEQRFLTAIFSTIHSFMGPILQLRTIGANS